MVAMYPLTPNLDSGAPFSAHRLLRAHQAVASFFIVCGFGFANWSTRIPSVREAFHLSNWDLGLLLLCTGIGSMVSFRVAGSLTRNFGSQKLATWGTAGFCVLLNAAPAMPGPLGAGAALLLLGFAAGFMDVCMNAQAVEVERLKGKPILSTLHGLCSLGALAGAGTGAAAAYWELSLTIHMILVTIPLLALTLWAGRHLLPPSGPLTAGTTQGRRGRFDAALLLLGGIGFCSSVGEGAMRSWVGVYLHDDLHVSLGAASLSYGCFSLAMVVGRLTCDRLTSRYTPQQVVRASGLMVTLALAAGLTVNTPWAILATATIVGLGLAPVIPAIFRLGGRLKGVAPSDALSTLATLSYGGGLFGPPTIGFVADNAGLRLGLGVVGLLALALTLLSGWMPEAANRD